MERGGGRGLRYAAVAGAALLLSTCMSGETGTEEAGRSEADGDARATPTWNLSEQPVLDLGRLDGQEPEIFHGVADVTLAPTGELIVADGGSREVRVFDAQGRHHGTFGGSGDGPGEFRMLDRVQALDDGRVAAFDPILRRVTLLDLQEGVAGVTRIATQHPTPLRVYRLLDDSLFLAYTGSANPTIPKGVDRERGEVLLVDTEGVTATVVAYRGNEMYVDGSRVFTLALPLSPDTNWRLGAPFGSRTFVDVSADYVALAESGVAQITLYDLDGSVERTIDWRQEPIPVTDEQREQYREAYVQGPQDEARREVLAAVGLPEAHPVISELHFGREGDLWVRGVDPDGMKGSTWRVFGVDGNLKAEVEIPRHLQVHDIGQDYIAGVHRDTVGVERVVVYSMSRN